MGSDKPIEERLPSVIRYHEGILSQHRLFLDPAVIALEEETIQLLKNYKIAWESGETTT